MERHAGQILSRRVTFKALLIVVVTAMMLSTAGAQLTLQSSDDATVGPYPLLFPVAGEHSYVDTFGAPRSGGRTHQGTDIFAEKLTPVVAVADGTVVRVATGDLAGRYIVIQHEGGWLSYYLHLNNDTPGTDDGLGGAPAPGIASGIRVTAGDILDYVGDSGNAEGTPSHLHFELHSPDGSAVNPTPHLDATKSSVNPGPRAPGTERSAAAQPPSHSSVNTELVGRFDPGGGFAAGLAVHDDVAYLGTWGRPDSCPASGIRIIDVTDPVHPEGVGVAADASEFPGTSTDSVWVGAVETASFTGNLAVVAVRLCDTDERSRWGTAFRGLAFYDVTDPEFPELLSAMHTGDRTQGANEVAVAARDDGTLLVGATVMQSLLHTEGKFGDFRLIDATDPSTPEEIADWDLRRDIPESVAGTTPGEFEEIDLHVHNVWLAPDGSSAWLAAWDAGIVMLDLEIATEPRFVTRVGFGTEVEGNAHTVTFDSESGLLIRNDEDLSAEGWTGDSVGWGGQAIYDAADLTNTVQLSTFMTEAAQATGPSPAGPGYFTAHEVEYLDGIEYVSWYSDGLRIVDLTDPTSPVEIGSFIPPATPDPQAHWTTGGGGNAFPMVWGVDLADGLIFLSDMNSGLWIVRYTEATAPPPPIGAANLH